jgi:ribosomal protein S18 acetylase RimI-like enzyme
MPSAAEIAHLDEVIAAAWRAPVVEQLDGWELRYGYGLTGRANSAWPRADRGRLRLEQKVARVEAFYREHGLQPKLQLSPASEPAGLDAELARRDWVRGTDVLIETADVPTATVPDRDVDLLDRPDDLWLDVWLSIRAFPRDRADRLLPMLGGGSGTVFARVGEVAVGRASLHDGWAAITCMATVPEARRRGAGRAVLDALRAWAGERRAGLCLNVDAANEPARRLYEGAGFAPIYPYWYRTAPA